MSNHLCHLCHLCRPVTPSSPSPTPLPSSLLRGISTNKSRTTINCPIAIAHGDKVTVRYSMQTLGGIRGLEITSIYEAKSCWADSLGGSDIDVGFSKISKE